MWSISECRQLPDLSGSMKPGPRRCQLIIQIKSFINLWKFRFFWAPLCKWGLVISALKDMARPAELLSVEQTVAIGSTGFIYSRFSMVIIPKNYTLLSVNVFVAITQSIQLFRALRYKYENRIEARKDE